MSYWRLTPTSLTATTLWHRAPGYRMGIDKLAFVLLFVCCVRLLCKKNRVQDFTTRQHHARRGWHPREDESARLPSPIRGSAACVVMSCRTTNVVAYNILALRFLATYKQKSSGAYVDYYAHLSRVRCSIYRSARRQVAPRRQSGVDGGNATVCGSMYSEMSTEHSRRLSWGACWR